ncbi:hypothetical protein EVAR_80597_1 [Eumeta japonica]|uniref:Uncharacterized protein n=1 Tax=Eumeta variegata TaxID=151549 RepID=A0A4C1TNQ3_EUMVA|nr:hypothetical protein EVAR_80597_1 [Eumeta japonica]
MVFILKGVFPWKSSGATKHEPTTHSGVSWRLFGSKSSGHLAADSSTAEGTPQRVTPASSVNGTPNHHRRQGSSASEKQFEDLIASSIALIQHDRRDKCAGERQRQSLTEKA